MQPALSYRHRVISDEDLVFIDGDKAAAGTMSLEAFASSVEPRVNAHTRPYAAGLNTRASEQWVMDCDQPIVLNERQAGGAIQGIKQSIARLIGLPRSYRWRQVSVPQSGRSWAAANGRP